jgi:predicted acyltransferase
MANVRKDQCLPLEIPSGHHVAHCNLYRVVAITANMMQPMTPTAHAQPAPERMLFVDAFRGFDMFWLIGGYYIVKALVAWINWPPLTEAAEREMDHPVWSGFHWWDVIMPTFIFISGVTIPLAITRRLERGESKTILYWRLLKRLVLLQCLNLAYYGALQNLDWHQMRFGGVLAHIGWAYFFAGIIAIHTKPRQQFIWALGILLGYWSAMTLIPMPGAGTGLMTPDGSLAGYIDRSLMPGILYGELYEREGLFATVPTIATVLMGALAGHWLLSDRKGTTKVFGLLGAGVACRLLGQLWSLSMPINTKMWTPSLVLAAGGWSLIFRAAFYLVIDVWQLRRWAFFFVVIGMNSIFIYFLPVIVDLDQVASRIYHGFVLLFPKPAQPLLTAVCAMIGVQWLLLWLLHRKKIYLRA